MCTYSRGELLALYLCDVIPTRRARKAILAVVCGNHFGHAHVNINICAHCSAVRSVSMIGNHVRPANLC